MVVIVNWPDDPILTVSMFYDWFPDPNWTGGTNQLVSMGEQIKFTIKFRYSKPYGGSAKIRIYIEKLVNSQWVSLTPVFPDEYRYYPDDDEWYEHEYDYYLDITQKIEKFKISYSVEDGKDQGWTDPSIAKRTFTAITDYIGDFSLEYLPITLLYCPPEQDMYNALTQGDQYGSITSFGFQETVGTKEGRNSTVKGGISSLFGGFSIFETDSVEISDSLTEAMTSKVTFTYDWFTTLIADNQKVIGRRYWGPLGDLFLLVRNPWFTVLNDENGDIFLTSTDLFTDLPDTEYVVLPAHKLLLPGDDPVASKLSENARKNLLKLDPNFYNIDEFFPEHKVIEPDGILCYVKKIIDPDHVPIYRAYNYQYRSYIYYTSLDLYQFVTSDQTIWRRDGIICYILKPDTAVIPAGYVPLYIEYFPLSAIASFERPPDPEIPELGGGRFWELLGHVILPDFNPIPDDYVPLYCARRRSDVHSDHLTTEILRSLDCSEVINPNPNFSADNRATQVAKYCISQGVQLELTRKEVISVDNQISNSQNHSVEVTKTNGFSIDSSISFFNYATVNSGVSDSSYTGRFTSVTHHNSVETINGKVKNAFCRLLRNQNAAILDDIEVWFDKLFSTFMFKYADKGLFVVTGFIFGFFNELLYNIEGIIINMDIILGNYGDLIRSTMLSELGYEPNDPIPDLVDLSHRLTEQEYDIEKILAILPSSTYQRGNANHKGNYSFTNLQPGRYLLKFGDKFQSLEFTLKDDNKRKTINFNGVKRILNLRKAFVWELQAIAGCDKKTARKIQLAMNGVEKEEELLIILAKYKINLSEVKKKANIVFPKDDDLRYNGIMTGKVFDDEEKGINNLKVSLINSDRLKNILKEDGYENFLRNFPKLNLNQIIKKLPKNSVYTTFTNSKGKYSFNYAKAGNYILILGNQIKKDISITTKSIIDNKNKVLRIEETKNVKRVVDIKSLPTWDLRSALKIPISIAEEIKQNVEKDEENLRDSENFRKLLLDKGIKKKTIDKILFETQTEM